MWRHTVTLGYFSFVSCVYSVLMHGLRLWNPFACKFFTFPCASSALLWHVHRVSPGRRQVRESLRIDLLVPPWLFARIGRCRKEQEGEKNRACVSVLPRWVIYLFLQFFFVCLSNLICFSSGHQENFSICDFKLPPSVPLAPWGNTSCLTFHVFFFVLFCNSITQQRVNWFAKQAHKNSSSLKKKKSGSAVK